MKKTTKTSKKTTSKRNAKTPASKGGRLVAIGNRASGFIHGTTENYPACKDSETSPLRPFAIGLPCLPFPKTDQGGEEGQRKNCELHAQGKACGLAWVDSLSWVSSRNATFVVKGLNEALASGELVAYPATITRDGKTLSTTLYAPASHNPKRDKQLHSYACADIPAGRVETKSAGARNVSLRYKVKFA